MTYKSVKFLLPLILIIIGCSMEDDNKNLEDLKKEIIKVEKDFANLVKTDGMAKAFLMYAAENAVLNRNNNLIKGKEKIQEYFEHQTITDIKLEWKPDFVDVANSGDLAYTYGKYSFSALSSNGEKINSTGIFHTVWKKQNDGTWKYVWD